MADNKTVDNGTGTDYTAATDEVTYSGDTADVQLLRPVHVSGTEGAKTVVDVTQAPGSAAPGAAVAVGGTDGTNLRLLKLDTSGEAQVDVLSVTPGTAAGNLGKAEDAGHTTGDTGVMLLGVRNDAHATLSTTDLDYTPIAVDAEGNVMVVGSVAHDAADADNPVKVGGKAITALPTAVADADRANFVTDPFGRQLVTHIPSAIAQSKAVNYTTTQTGAAVWTPGSGKRVVVTSVVVGSYGTTSGRLILWFGAGGDTTYTAGTDQPLLLASFAPSTTSKPGLVFCPAVPVYGSTADYVLRITTDAAMSVDVTVHGYEI